jgi:SAM-dependent methyltransferase
MNDTRTDTGANRASNTNPLWEQFGLIDIYLFDQLLRGRIAPSMRVLDAGCGPGLNSHYLMRSGAPVHAVDEDPEQIERIRSLAAELAPDLPADNFKVASLTALPFEDSFFSAVICAAVLHFADDELQFEEMVNEMWRVLASGGIFFARLATTIGIEDLARNTHGRWYSLPDGTERFLVDEEYLLRLGEDLGGDLVDALKTTNVQNLRAMTTWVLRKP